MKITSIPKSLKMQTEPSGKLYNVVEAEASIIMKMWVISKIFNKLNVITIKICHASFPLQLEKLILKCTKFNKIFLGLTINVQENSKKED